MKYIILLACLAAFCTAENETPWTVKDASGNPCVLAVMSVAVKFTYTSINSTQINLTYEIPVNHTKVDETSSSCASDIDKLVVSWGAGNSFEVIFENGTRTDSYDLKSILLALNKTDIGINDSDDNNTVKIAYSREVNSTFFETPSNFSFHCTQKQTLNSTNMEGSTISLSKVQFEAFKLDKKNTFSLAKDCESNHFKPEIVPIAVGLSLIALIIIVLVAYIVGRRRQQARGYLNIM